SAPPDAARRRTPAPRRQTPRTRYPEPCTLNPAPPKTSTCRRLTLTATQLLTNSCPMPVIDADTHIDECDDTWSYLRPDELKYKPGSGEAQPGEGATPFTFWMVDGVSRLKPLRRT